MKKINLKLLSVALGITMFLPAVPVNGLDYSKVGYNVSKKDDKDSKDSLDEKKIIAGAGAAGLAACIGAGIWISTRDKSSFAGCDYTCLPNANFSNTHNLCFWHALIQQLYDVKAFRNFIKNVDLNKVSQPTTGQKIADLRELFAQMEEFGGANYKRFTADESYNFAEKILGADNIGEFQDIHDACLRFLGDVLEEYCQKCGGRVHDKSGSKIISNITYEEVSKIPALGRQLVLSDLLRDTEPSIQEREQALEKVWRNGTPGVATRDIQRCRTQLLKRLPLSNFVKNGNQGELVVDKAALQSVTPAAKEYSSLDDKCRNSMLDSFDCDPVRPGILDDDRWREIEADWNSDDVTKRTQARKRVFGCLPIGVFWGKNGNLNADELRKFVNQGTLDRAKANLEKATDFKTPCVKTAFDQLARPEVNIDILDDQFAIFVSRFNRDMSKSKERVSFGDGKVVYKNQTFELTAVTVHTGSANSGHYYTYKKQGGCWYKYNDATIGYSGEVSWNKVKSDAEENCTMLTFSKPGIVVRNEATVDYHRVEPMNKVTPDYVSKIISKVESVPDKDTFEIVQKCEKNPLVSGVIVDPVFLSGVNKNYNKIAIIDAADTECHAVDPDIICRTTCRTWPNRYGPAESGFDPEKIPGYDGLKPKTRIKEGGALIRSSYNIGRVYPNIPYVIQTVSPKVKEEKDLPLFYSAWYQAVRLGIAHDCDALIIPMVSMDVFLENKSKSFAKKCARVAVQAIQDAKQNCLIKIVMVDCKDEGRNAAFRDELAKIIH